MALDNYLFYIGLFTVVCILAKVADHIYIYIRPSSLLSYRRSKETYALVTGATDGIGRGLAYELCANGFNVVLHGRNPEKLRRVQGDLKKDFPNVKTRTLVFDASQSADTLRDAVRDLKDIELTVLINNVGGQHAMTQSDFPTLQELACDEIDRIMNVNIRFMTQLTSALLPILQRSAPAVVVNISSMAQHGMPYITVYSGSKGYTNVISKAVNLEMRAEGKEVDVISMLIGEVKTPGNDTKVGLFAPTPRPVARAILARVGCGKTSVVPYFPHRVQTIVFDIFPERIMRFITVKAMRAKVEEVKQQHKRAD